MVKYTNLGFTQRESEVFDAAMVASREAVRSDGIPQFPARSYVMTSEGASINSSINDWEKLGRPYYLTVLERYGKYSAVLDTGYGALFLLDTESGKVAYTSGSSVALGDALMVDAEYYGLESFLYIRANK